MDLKLKPFILCVILVFLDGFEAETIYFICYSCLFFWFLKLNPFILLHILVFLYDFGSLTFVLVLNPELRLSSTAALVVWACAPSVPWYGKR